MSSDLGDRFTAVEESTKDLVDKLEALEKSVNMLTDQIGKLTSASVPTGTSKSSKTPATISGTFFKGRFLKEKKKDHTKTGDSVAIGRFLGIMVRCGQPHLHATSEFLKTVVTQFDPRVNAQIELYGQCTLTNYEPICKTLAGYLKDDLECIKRLDKLCVSRHDHNVFTYYSGDPNDEAFDKKKTGYKGIQLMSLALYHEIEKHLTPEERAEMKRSGADKAAGAGAGGAGAADDDEDES